jgi:hypothetical protein
MPVLKEPVPVTQNRAYGVRLIIFLECHPGSYSPYGGPRGGGGNWVRDVRVTLLLGGLTHLKLELMSALTAAGLNFDEFKFEA